MVLDTSSGRNTNLNRVNLFFFSIYCYFDKLVIDKQIKIIKYRKPHCCGWRDLNVSNNGVAKAIHDIYMSWEWIWAVNFERVMRVTKIMLGGFGHCQQCLLKILEYKYILYVLLVRWLTWSMTQYLKNVLYQQIVFCPFIINYSIYLWHVLE